MKRTILFALGIILSISGFAYDFEKDGIYYTITSMNSYEVEVASGENSYSGDVNIPETVSYNGVEFTITGIQSGYREATTGGHTGERWVKGAFTSSSVTSVTIPKTITSIGNGVFAHCYNLSDIVLPSTLSLIGNGTFYGTRLTSFVFPEDLKTIGYSAFWSSALQSVTINSKIESIGTQAFRYCSSLNAVNIPSIEAWCNISFGSYEGNPLYYAGHLFQDGKEITQIVIGSNITVIGTNSFYGFTGLEQVEFERGIKKISSNAFYGCSNLERLILPEGLTEISDGSFEGCTYLRKIVLPSSLSSIGHNAFGNCNSVDSILSHIKEPMPISAFSNSTFLFTPLYVPSGTSSKYKQTSGWSSFNAIFEMDETGDVATYYTLTLKISDGGFVSYDNREFSNTNATLTIKEGETATLSFFANNGYRLKSLTINGDEVTGSVKDDQYNIDNIKEDLLVEVMFEEIPLTLTIQHAENGLLKQFIQRGACIKFALMPAEGWKVNSVTYNGIDVTSELNSENEYTTPAIYEDATLSVSFESTQSAVNSARVSNAKVYASNGQIIVAGVEDGNMISVYDESGKIITQTVARSNEQRLSIQSKGIYIVKVEGKTVKVSL